MSNNTTIGIDLGTTFSCVAVCRNKRIEVIDSDQGSRLFPSYVAYKGEQILAGQEAKEQAESNPANTIFDSKRFLGRRFSDEDVQNEIKRLPFTVVCDQNQPKFRVTVGNETKNVSPEEIASVILRKLKKAAESYLEIEDIKNAVITVPANFNDAQRKSTIDAGKIAGLTVLQIFNEPTAVAYGIQKEIKELSNICIFDLGGGTYDVSILEIEGTNFEVKSTHGDKHLGGEDFTDRLKEHLVNKFLSDQSINLSINESALRKLKYSLQH